MGWRRGWVGALTLLVGCPSPASLEATVAHVVALRGQATVADDEVTDARVAPSRHVVTGAHERARVHLDDGATLLLVDAAEVVIDRKDRATHVRGRLFAEAPEGHPLELALAHGRLRLADAQVLVEPTADLFPVDRVDPAERFGNWPRLVRLDRADEMPLE